MISVEELCATKELLKKSQQQQSELQLQANQLRTEMEELQTAAAIAEVGKEEEVAKTQRQYHEELASFQHILEGTSFFQFFVLIKTWFSNVTAATYAKTCKFQVIDVKYCNFACSFIANQNLAPKYHWLPIRKFVLASRS
jgi:hypothetical protein